jgi:hypothetical protein
MPRGRKQLTDKQERILVQCQLMGLTTADMVQISNRLKALDVERTFKARVDEFSSGFTWKSVDHRNFTITGADGKVYEVKVFKDHTKMNWNHGPTEYANITVSKPGTRFKPRVIKNHKLDNRWEDIEIAGVCPDGNKLIFRTMRDIKKGLINENRI